MSKRDIFLVAEFWDDKKDARKVVQCPGGIELQWGRMRHAGTVAEIAEFDPTTGGWIIDGARWNRVLIEMRHRDDLIEDGFVPWTDALEEEGQQRGT